MRNLQDAIARELELVGQPLTPVNRAKILNKVAWDNRDDGWGLSHKSTGEHVVRSDGEPIAEDILHHQPSNLLFDVFAWAGDHYVAAWQNQGSPLTPDRVWVAPIQPEGSGTPGPTSPTTGSTVEPTREQFERLLGMFQGLVTTCLQTSERCAKCSDEIRLTREFIAGPLQAKMHTLAEETIRQTTEILKPEIQAVGGRQKWPWER